MKIQVVVKLLLNINPGLFKSATSIAVLIGFLSIQFHSFVHHHGDDHYSSEAHNHQLPGKIYLGSPSDHHDSDKVECPTCVLTKHINSVIYDGNFLYPIDSEYYSIPNHSDHTQRLYYLNQRLRAPPSVV